mmetsp:Transcript_8036/g.8733  ORF Transcript_8036/g.8733 Transcript_8036/m.8733 type:complete len:175 (+) Transcript_8036:1-525(+)
MSQGRWPRVDQYSGFCARLSKTHTTTRSQFESERLDSKLDYPPRFLIRPPNLLLQTNRLKSKHLKTLSLPKLSLNDHSSRDVAQALKLAQNAQNADFRMVEQPRRVEEFTQWDEILDGFMENRFLVRIDLARNFQLSGSLKKIGLMLSVNASLRSIDLSWSTLCCRDFHCWPMV